MLTKSEKRYILLLKGYIKIAVFLIKTAVQIYLYYIFYFMSTFKFEIKKNYVNYLCKPHNICLC